MKKTYIYYANEQYGYETEKQVVNGDLRQTVEDFLKEDYIEGDEAEVIANELITALEKDGYAYEMLVNGQNYEIVIGLAQYGKCSEITSVIADCRREMRYYN